MGEYKSSEKRLIEARNHYKNLLNEEGFPGMCCDGGPNCVAVTFNSANDDCATLMMDECTHADCQGTIDPSGGTEEALEDLTVDTGTGTSQQVSCAQCDTAGNVVMVNMFPSPPGCPSGWVSDPGGGINPCAQTSDPCAFPDISGPCATQADLVNQFVNGSPNQFLSNMLSWYTNPPNPQNFPGNRGCNFLEVVRQKHIGHLATGYAINNNNPAPGVQMGPLWVAQKTSKVAYLDCVLAQLAAHNCCTGGSSTGGGNTGGTSPIGTLQGKLGSNETPKGIERKGMKV